jgi:glycosyltransferase involved in cell wall biosynthesis
MTRTFHLLTGEYPPNAGGVGDYTELLAHGLTARGCDVHVWSPGVMTYDDRGVHLHHLPDAFGAASRKVLEEGLTGRPGCVLLQYVPNAVGARGANLPFCLWLLRLRRSHEDVRVMFHEPYFYFSWGHPLGNVLAVLQRAMAAVLLRASGVAYMSTASWVPYLRPWNSSDTTLVASPVPSTIAAGAAPDDIARWRQRVLGGVSDAVVVGHFGTFGDHVARQLEPVIKVLLYTHATARFICMGRGSETFVARFNRRNPSLARRMDATGPISSGELAAALRACDMVVQPYPDGVTTRRTSVMAALANAVATVSTDGALTEPVWHETGAVALAPASNARAIGSMVVELLRDPAARAALAETGRRTYDERFALELTVDRLLSTAPVHS